MRQVVYFSCERETLLGSLDEAVGTTGLLIVSGGNEVRAGSHRSMARLAQRAAALGFPAFRFDRRGVGDSTGENGGYVSSLPDIRAALTVFRERAPSVTRIVAMGNCDAASALMLFGERLDLAGLILTNPWLGEDRDGLPPAPAIRRRYLQRLSSPLGWRDLIAGRVSYSNLFKGLGKLSARSPELSAPPVPRCPVTLVLARGDATAQGFAARWQTPAFAAWREQTRLVQLATASHSFAGADDALLAAVVGALA